MSSITLWILMRLIWTRRFRHLIKTIRTVSICFTLTLTFFRRSRRRKVICTLQDATTSAVGFGSCLNFQKSGIRALIISTSFGRARTSFKTVFFFNDPAPTEIYTLSLHDALPIYACRNSAQAARLAAGGLTELATRV